MSIIEPDEARQIEQALQINKLAAEVEALKSRQAVADAGRELLPTHNGRQRTPYDLELAERLEHNRQGRLRQFEEAEQRRLKQLEKDAPKIVKRDQEIAALTARHHEASKAADEALAVAQGIFAEIIKKRNEL